MNDDAVPSSPVLARAAWEHGQDLVLEVDREGVLVAAAGRAGLVRRPRRASCRPRAPR